MEEKEILVDGEKINVTIKMPKEMIEDNSMERLLDDTIPLEKIVKEIQSNDEK